MGRGDRTDFIGANYYSRVVAAPTRKPDGGIGWRWVGPAERGAPHTTMGWGQRFGLIYVDYQTLKRTVKDSGRWYRDWIATQARKEHEGEKLGA